MNADFKNESIFETNDVKNIGILKVSTANHIMEMTNDLPPITPLYDCLWYEEEVSCLYASTNLGKSILAVQIANEIAKTRTVLYVDCELSDRQFMHRYSSEKSTCVFAEGLYRATIDIAGADGMDEEQLINSIHEAAVDCGAKVIVIDNLSWLSMSSEKAADATKLMRKMIGLRNEYKYSILIVAHTPKVPKDELMTDNHLAGSKILMNFMDSAFCIGLDAKDKNGRYIKQTKVRADEYRYDENNVMVCKIVKTDSGALIFETIGYATEREMKRSFDKEADKHEKLLKAKRSYAQGWTIRRISDHLHVGHNTFKKADLESPETPDIVEGASGLEEESE